MPTSPAHAAHVKAAIFLASPSVQTLRDLCEAGDFGAGPWRFERKAIRDLCVQIGDLKGFSVSVGRGLSRSRTFRTIYEGSRDVTGVYDARLFRADGRRVREEHHTQTIEIRQFSIRVSSRVSEYLFGAGFDRLDGGVDLEALLPDQQRSEVDGSNR